MVDQLTRRQCSWCGRQATDFMKEGKYFCDNICWQEYVENNRYNGY